MEPENIASQLRCPNGKEASDVALKMNDANRSVNQKCIELLQIASGDKVLEIGPGNGAFAADIVGSAEEVIYTGLDWSADMVAQASQLNSELLAQGSVNFQSGSSDKLPFEPGTFNKILTVHTLYFWEHPADHLSEIRRVLQPDGLFCIAFGDRSFMKELPFVPYGFNLYDIPAAQDIMQAVGFRVVDVQKFYETGRSNTGDIVEKLINIMVGTPQ
ncbi:SAM-dependent methyltransferase [Aliidiomarina minuta]|uniref:SAM-dependent methyltransferase n=1 Tax=Aliidiomarina minuta TaxID=880057 RepID=A0A432W966_9GAMM|nr:class I SAM-dependent methyltransferase [Aliidiomarina minuta]RUO26526.1 SAM-dependent methyltransferase [Aliidiomarina minuta]